MRKSLLLALIEEFIWRLVRIAISFETFRLELIEFALDWRRVIKREAAGERRVTSLQALRATATDDVISSLCTHRDELVLSYYYRAEKWTRLRAARRKVAFVARGVENDPRRTYLEPADAHIRRSHVLWRIIEKWSHPGMTGKRLRQSVIKREPNNAPRSRSRKSKKTPTCLKIIVQFAEPRGTGERTMWAKVPLLGSHCE